MNERNYRENCYFHPKEMVIGVCHLCLNERLLILATKHGVNKSNSSQYKTIYGSSSSYHHRENKPKSHSSLPKIFAISSFFNTRENGACHRTSCHRRRQCRRDSDREFIDYDADATSTSLEDDSFISIKFGENGMASWENKTSNTMSKLPLEHCNNLSWDASNTTNKPKGGGTNNNTKSVVEHGKPRPVMMRWRKRIGQILQIMKWKKYSKANGGGNNSKVVGRSHVWRVE